MEASRRMLRIGIDGMGGMGKVYLENFKHIPHCRVVAVASRSFSAEQANTQQARVYAELAELLAFEELDVVCICAPTHLHVAHAKMALRKRVNVIAEKPLALHEEEAAALYKLAAENGVQLFAAHVLRFAYTSQVLRQLIESAQYGGVVDAYFARLSPAPVWSKGNWAFDADKSGLVPFDLHIHDLDLIISLFGEPSTALMRKGGAAGKPYAEFSRFYYGYDGFNVFAEAAWYDVQFPFTTCCRIYFERGLAVCQGDIITVYAKDRAPVTFTPPQTMRIETGTQVPKTDMYLKQLIHFLDCARENKPSDIVKREEVIAALRILTSMENVE